MGKNKFSITYESITPESAENGEADESGFIDDCMSLREVWESVRNAGMFDHCEASDSRISQSRWITFYGMAHDWENDSTINWSLHFPDSLTPASRTRIARLFRAYGVK